MALADTGGAIGAVTQLLHDRLLARLGGPGVVADVTAGRPEPAGGAPANPRLNLFLYEVQFDGHLRNRTLDEGQPAPLWLVLRYLLTAFDRQGESDTIGAHRIVGEAIRVLQDLNFFSLAGLDPNTIAALTDNPDLLKLTFEEANVDLLSKVMQGTDERYRCSVGFQVRPVMIADAAPPDESLLVGIDYTAPATIGDAGIVIPIIPSTGPTVSLLDPPRFRVAQEVTIVGEDLHLAGLSVFVSSLDLLPTSQRPNRLTFRLPDAVTDGAILSAGNHVITVARQLPSGRYRQSNPLVGGLLPRLDAAVPSLLARTVPADADSPIIGRLDLTGRLLGTAEDDISIAFYRDGRVVRAFDTAVPIVLVPPPFQAALRLDVPVAGQLPPGDYRIILRVNGQQAVNSPLVRWRVP